MATAHAWKACRSNPTQVRVLSPPPRFTNGTLMFASHLHDNLQSGFKQCQKIILVIGDF